MYETSDGEYVSIGSIEAKFYKLLLEKTGLENEELPHQMDVTKWADLKEKFAAIFKTKTRAEWCDIMEGSDICFAPVLSMQEAMDHPHNVARGSFVEVGGVKQPGPAPKFSRTPSEIQRPPLKKGEHTDEALADWGVANDRIGSLKEQGVIK